MSEPSTHKTPPLSHDHRRHRRGRRQSDIRIATAPRILLVEPHDDTRLLYASLFEDAGYAVYAVSTGADAIAVARHRLPDIVIMEMVVPDFDGFAILQAIRGEHDTANLPILVVTSMLHFGVPQRARESGATVVLSKPIQPDTVMAAAEDLLAGTLATRLTRRQLRRSLLTLRKIGASLDERAKDRIRGLIDRLQIAVLAMDDDGHLVAASAGAESLTGYARNDLLRMSVFDAGFGPHLPLARSWDEFISGSRDSSQATLYDSSGRAVTVETSFATIVPGLHAAALVAPSTVSR